MPKKIHVLLLLPLLMSAAYCHAETAYVTDSITVGIFKSAKLNGKPLERLPSGALVDVLQSSTNVAEIKTGSGKTGWVRTSFLTKNLPAAIQLENADHELSKANTALGKTKSALEKAKIKIKKLEQTAKKASKDVNWMKAEMTKARKKAAAAEAQLKSKQGLATEVEQQAETLDSQLTELKLKNADLEQRLAATLLINAVEEVDVAKTEKIFPQEGQNLLWSIAAAVLALLVGFAAGYYWLDRRVRQRFGGVRVY